MCLGTIVRHASEHETCSSMSEGKEAISEWRGESTTWERVAKSAKCAALHGSPLCVLQMMFCAFWSRAKLFPHARLCDKFFRAPGLSG